MRCMGCLGAGLHGLRSSSSPTSWIIMRASNISSHRMGMSSMGAHAMRVWNPVETDSKLRCFHPFSNPQLSIESLSLHQSINQQSSCNSKIDEVSGRPEDTKAYFSHCTPRKIGYSQQQPTVILNLQPFIARIEAPEDRVSAKLRRGQCHALSDAFKAYRVDVIVCRFLFIQKSKILSRPGIQLRVARQESLVPFVLKRDR